MLKVVKIFILLLPVMAFAQNGPGGVGSTDGTSELVLWLTADSIPGVNNGNPVNDWPDISGYGHDANSDSSYLLNVNTPIFLDTIDNSGRNLKAVRFDGTDDWYDNNHTYTAQTIFLVYNLRNSLQGSDDLGQFWGSYADGAHVAVDTRVANQDGLSFDGANANVNGGIYAFNSATYGGSISNGNSPAVTRDQWEILAVQFNSPQSVNRQVLGSLHPNFSIDAHNLGADMAEVIVYSGTLNSAQRLSVENYLSTKYNIDITASGNDHYAYDDDFGAHVAGIGNESASYDTAAFSSLILGVDTLAATSLDAGDFLFFGHDNGAISWTTVDVPTMGLGNIQRITREWRFDETNDLGSLRFLVDTTQLGTLPVGFDRYVLIVGNTSTLADAKAYEMTRLTGSRYWGVNFDVSDGDYVSVGVVDPVLGFENSSTNEFETVGSPALSIKLNYIPSSDVNFNYATSDNGATGGIFPFGGGTDYETIASTPATILAGADPPSIDFNLRINEDSDQESDEGIDISITNQPVTIQTLNEPQTFTIRDDDNARKLYFAAADSTVNESAGTINIQVNMTPSQVDPTNPTTVDYTISGGTAAETADFNILGGGTLTIPINNISATFPVSIVDDALSEAVETVVITLANPTNSNLSISEPTTFTIHIADNDPAPSIQFDAASSNNAESVTNPSILLTLSAVAGLDVDVNYTISGTATGGGDDFTLVNGTATIVAGNISTSIDPVIVSDADPEADETLVLTLSSPINATLGSEPVHTYTIVNDDGSFGFTGPGGVGGSSVMPLWLKADSLTALSDGDAIPNWEDVSGSDHDATQGTASYRATWENGVADQINGFPVVRFDGVDDHYDDTGYSYGAKMVFIVFKISSTLQSTSELAHIWGSYNELVHVAPEPRGGGDQFGFSFDGNQTGSSTARYGLDGEDYGALVDDGNYYPWSYDVAHLVSVKYDAEETLTRQILGGLVDNFAVGAHHYGGDIAEIIVFDQDLNEARRNIVENYLAAKYGITMPVAKDLYAHESTHYYDVAGIGQGSGGNTHWEAQSNNIVRVTDASHLGNNEYLLFGHDNGALAWSAVETPADSIRRIAREWILDETGDVGSVTVAIDTSYLLSKPTDHNEYVLLVDDNGDFSSGDGGTTVIPLARNGQYYEASEVDVGDGQYLSIGTVGITARWTLSPAAGDEALGTYDVSVSLSRSSAGTTDFTFSVDGGSSATEGGGADFTLSPTLQIAAGNTTGNLTITINDDTDLELDERIILNLVGANNGVAISSENKFYFTIYDNDALAAGTTGPGGIYRASNYEAWWNADSAVFSDLGSTAAVDGGIVQQWNDLSGSVEDHPATVFSVGYEPQYNLTTALVNGKPAIDFSVADSALTVLNETELNVDNQTRRTFAFAFETGADLTTRQIIYEEGGTGNGMNLWLESGVLHLAIWDNTWDDGGTQEFYEFTTSSALLASTPYVAYLEYYGPTKTLSAYVNSELLGSTVIAGTDGTLWSGHGGNIGIGGLINNTKYAPGNNGVGDGDMFGGKIMEILVLNEVLNDAQRLILQNYLGAKYNANLTAGTDLFNHKTTHSYGVAGIGQQGSDFHTAATSDSLLTISNPSALTGGDFLMMGHDNGSIASYDATEVSGGDFVRLAREWRVTHTGDVGTVRVTFDPSFVSPSPGAEFTQYALLVDSDGDFTAGSSVHTLYQNGAVYQAEVALSDGDFLAIASFRPTIQFVPATATATEAVTSVSAIARLTYPVDRSVSAYFALNAGNSTAVRGTGPTDDFDFSDGLLTINEGDSTATINITINDDSDIEALETFEIDLYNPSAGLFIGDDTTYVYSIQDDDQLVQVEFTMSTDTVMESNGSFNMTIRLTQASGLDVDVDYAVVAGSADGSDYTLIDGTATILNGGYATNVLLSLSDDMSFEDYETVVVQLSNAVNASIGSRDEFTLVIADDDPLPELSFATASVSGPESSSSATLTVEVSEAAGVPIQVDYEVVTANTTASGADYSLADGTLTIPVGTTSGDITATIVNDLSIEVDEVIQVRLYDAGSLSNATIGSEDTITYTIQDDDASGFVGPGGVGLPTDYETWLRADRWVERDSLTSAAATNGSIVQRWVDYSGKDNNAKGPTGMEPRYLVSAVNGKPSIDFGGLDSALYLDDAAMINTPGGPFATRTIIAAFKAGSDVATQQVVFEEGGGGRGFAIYIENGSARVAAWNGGDWPFDEITAPISPGQTMIAILEFNVGDGERLTGYFNADSIGSGLGKNLAMGNHGGDISIGGSTDGWEFGSGDFFEGEVMEIMVSNTALSTTQRTIVENYLGAKYGANLTPSGRKYFDYAASHSHGVVGIGRETDSDMHVKAQSDSLVIISNAADLDNGEYFFIGNDNGAASYTIADVPGSGIQRLGREWRITETGDVGAVSLSLDTGFLGLTPPAEYSEYVLMIDTDGIFASGATIVPLTANGSNWQTSIDLSDGDYFTFGVVRPQIQFAVATSNGSETTPNPALSIELNYALSEDLTFTVAETGAGSATEGADFSFTDGVQMIPAGSTTVDIAPVIVNDAEVESDETIVFEITSPSVGVVGANTTHTYTINDDDNFRKANLVLSDSTNSEDQAPIQIGVFLNVRNTTSPTEVFYAVSGGTAENDSVDYYVQATDTLVFAPNDTLEFIDIHVVNDLIDENDETVMISLIGGSGATLGDTTNFTYTIVDDDASPTVQFSSATRSGAESAQTVDLAIELSAASGKDIVVPFSATDLSATADVDYQLPGASIVIPAGGTTDSIQFVVLNDGLTEANEQLRIDLGSPTNATIGTNGSLTYTILDDDGLGFEGLGGVGNLNEQIAAWFKATEPGFGLSNGDDVANLLDNSNNGNDGFQSTPSMQPQFLDGVWNGRPVIAFDGDDLIALNDTDDINTGGPFDQKTIMVAFRTATDVTTRQMIYEEGGGVRGLSIYIDNGSIYIGGWNNNDDDAGATTPWPNPGPPTNNTVFTTRPVAPNSNNFVFLQFDFLAGSGSIDGDVSASINGEDLVTVDGAGRLFAHSGDIGIGGINQGTVVHDGNEGSVENYNGNLGEVVIQNFVYNPAQFVIVNNYLSSKYNIALTSVPDVYAHDQNPSNYSYEVIGIGQMNDSSHIDAQGAGMVRLSNPTQLDNDEFMLMGHSGGGGDSWISSGVPNGDTDNFRRLDRTWRMDETGDVGLVTIQMDASSLPSPPIGFTPNYVMMVDADGDFSDGASVYGLTSAGGYYGISNVDIPDDSYITFGLANLVVGFALASSDQIEDMSPAAIEVRTNYVVSSALTVDIAATPNSTAQLADYSLSTSTINIAGGTQSGTLNINLVNDGDEEPIETVELALSNPNQGMLSDADTTLFTIIDDDQARNIQFVLTDSTGNESDSPAMIRVFADSLSSMDSLKVYYQVTAGTATSTDDYVLVADTLKWPRYTDDPNDTIRTISLAIVPDLLNEDDETIEITLFNPVQAGFGTNRVFTYTITDDDAQPTIDWQTTSTSGLETVTEVHAIVQLSAASGQDIVLTYSNQSSDPPTPGGIDYDLQGTSITIPAGNLQDTITFTVFDDAIVGEANEDVVIRLEGATNASANVGSIFTYTIIDDDGGFGGDGPGGVGDADQLAFWLRGDAEVFNDLGTTAALNGNDVRQWNDQGGNGNNATEVAASDSLPSFEMAVASANDQDGLSFDPTNFEFLTIPDNSLINTAAQYTQKTIAVVFETGPSATPATNQIIYEQGGGGNGMNIFHGTDGNLHFAAWSTAAAPSWSYSEVTTAVGANQLVMAIFELDADAGTLDVYIDGNAPVSGSTGVTNSFLNSHGGDPGIGGMANDTRFSTGTESDNGFFFEGRIFELVEYNERVLTDPTRKILRNYFAAKYGISIGTEDIYAHETNYEHEVFGMGIENDEIHVSSSGSGIVRIDNPLVITNGNYLLSGHDGGAANAFTTTDTPPEFSNTFMERIERTWRVDESGDFGNVRVSVDVTQLPSFTPGFNDLYLMVGTASNFSTYDTLVLFNETFGNELRTTFDFNDNQFFTLALANNASGQVGAWNDPDTWLIGVPGAGQPAFLQDSVYLTGDVTASVIVGLDTTPADRGKLNLNGFTLTVTDSLLIRGFGPPARDTTSFAANNGVVNYATAGDDIFIQPLIYYDLTLSGTGRRHLSDKTVILNDLVIDDNPQVITNNHNLDVSGDWVSAVNATFAPGTSTVTFNGSGPQQIRPTNKKITFNNLIIDNVGGDVSLADTVEITGTLTLTQNDLVIGAERLIISNSDPNAIVGAGDNSSYIQTDGIGAVEWTIVQGNTYTFPVGDGAGNYTPFSFTPSSLAGTAPTLAINLSGTRQSRVDAAQAHISRYWTIEPTGVTSATFDVTFTYTDTDVSGDEMDLVPIKFNVDADTSDFPTFLLDAANNTLSWSGLTSFSEVTAGAEDDPLPVELLRFQATVEDNDVVLNWSTATEINNDRFEILWSDDGIHFQEIAEIPGVGNSVTLQTYTFVDDEAIVGVNYYRLRQVDFDGTTALSSIVSAETKGVLRDFQVIVYPNPTAAHDINLRFLGLKQQPLRIALLDALGRLVMDEWLPTPVPNYHLQPTGELSPGLHYLIITDGQETYELKVIVH